MAKKSLQETYSRVMEKTPAQAYRATQDDPSVNTGDSAVRMYQAVMGAPETYRAYGNRGQSQGNSAYQKYQSIMNGAGGNRTQKITDWTNRYSRLASGLKNGYTQELVDEADSLAKAYNGASGVAYAARRDERDALEKIYKSLLEIGTDGKKQLARERTASGLLPEDANALAGQKQKYERMLFELQKQRDTFLKDNPQTVAPGSFAETQEITPMGNYGAIAGQDTVGYGTQPTAQQKQLDALMQSIRETQGTIGDINSQLNIYNRIDKFGDDVTAKYAGGNSMEAREAWRTGKDGREQTFREKEQALRKDSTPYAARESGVSGNAYAAALSNPQSADFTERLNDYKSEKNRQIIDRLDEYLTWFDGLSEESQRRIRSSDVNGQNPYRDSEIIQNDPGNQNKHWGQMTEYERNAVFQIANTEGTDAAVKYLEDLQMTLDRRQTLDMEQNEKDRAEKTPLIGDMLRGAATVGANLVGAPISFIGNARDAINGKGVNPYSNANFLLNQSRAVREASSQEVYRAIAGDGSNKKLDFLGNLASNAYQAGLSTLDSLAGMATMGKFYTISMGMGAASQRMRELVESGASDREIYVGAIGSGILEALFEKVSLDTFADQWIKANPEKFIRKALIQAGVEGSEEVFTEISNQILDAVNRGVNSDHNVRVRALMKENPGMSETEAEQQAASEDAQEVFWAGFGGALSGGLSSFGGLAIEGHKARQGGTEILNRGQAGEVLQNALELRPNDKTAQNLQAKLSDNTLGQKGRDLSGLYRVAQQNAADMTHADVEAVRAGLEKRFTEMGVPNNGKATAEAIIKQITGEKLSLTDRLALAKNRDAAATVRSEIISAAIEETAENKWVRDIKTFQLGRLGHGKQAFGTAETQTQKSARETMEKALNQVMGSNSAIVSAMYDEGQSRSDFTTEAAEIYRAGQDGRGLDGVSLSTIGASDAVKIYNMGVRSAEGVGTYDYIEEGQAYRKSDSTPVNVTGFASMGADPTVSIGNGETVKASDITFGSFGESRLYNTIAKMGVDTQTANDMLKAAESANINASTYSVALNNAYMQGLSGIAFGNIRENSEAMRLDGDTRKAAWSAGRAQAERNDRAKQSVTDKGKHGRKATGLTVEGSAKNVKLNRQQEAGMNAARVLAGMGLNVSVFASTEAERKDGAYNGIFRSSDGSIRVDLNAGNDGQGVMGYALSHEFTHFVEELSAEKFRKFTDILFDVLGKNDVDVNRLIEAKEAVLRNTEEYKGRSEKELRAIAYSEVVAEMMEPVLTDTDAISRISQKIKQQDKGLWGKIKDFIKGIVEKLKAAYRDMEPDSAIARLTRETVTNSEAVLDAFSEAAADAVLNYNLQDGQKNNAREGGLYSLREQTQQELTTQYQADVDSILNMQDTTQRQLLVGYTPSIYQELGMPSLPLTIGSGHVYSTAKTEAQARQDGNYKRGVHYHGLGDAAVKNIYNAIQDPVMIIAAKDVSKSASPMRSTHSVVAIVDIGTAGKSLLVPIEITAERTVNGVQMDVNTISSVYERNVSNLVKEAIALENSGDVGVYYAKKEALTLPAAGVRFPVRLQQSIASNSIIHRFSEKVNMKISENTQSQQFKRWFGDWQNDPAKASKVVNADGTPKVMYHGTNAEFTVFDRSKGKKKIHLNVLGDGNYFTASEQGAARYGENVVPAYLNIKNPYVKADGFNTVADQIASEFGIARDSFTGKDVSSILRQRGYDGVVMYDGNGEIVIANAFDSTQIKSATDNVGTFDGSNPDIRYSSRTSSDSEYLNLAQNPEENELELKDMVRDAAEKAGFVYRRNARQYHSPQNDVGWQMFVYGIDNDQPKAFGSYEFVATDEGAIHIEDVMPKLRELTEEFYGEPISDDEINPPDIITSAGIFDDMDFMEFLYENYLNDLADENGGEYPAFITADGLMVFARDDKRVKSLAAVEYDDNGNVIPLSQRFDTGKEDIRYSARNPQAQVEAENERLKSDVKRQIAEAVREYRRQQDVQSKAYRQMYERQLEEVKKSYQKQIFTMEAEYSADLAQIQDAFFQTVEAYEKGQFRNEHLEKALKQAMEAQRTQAKASEADNATWEKEFKRLLKAYDTSGRNAQRLKQTVEAQRARAKAKVEAARVTEQRGKLYRAGNEINRRLLNPTKTLYVPDSLAPAVTKFMQGLTEAMESPQNRWNVQGALETLQGQYQKLTQMNEGVFTQEYNQGILDLLDNAINAVGGTDFNKLSASQIEDVYSAVRSVLTAIRNENKMFAANLNKTYAEAAAAVRREESGLPNRKPTTGAVQDKAEKFGWNQLKPVYAMMRLGSDTLLKQYNNLRAGEDKWQRVIAAARAYGLGTMAKYNYDQWDDSLMKLETETGTVELSLQERMSLYAYARREQAFEHLTKGGFVLSDKNTRTVKNRFGIETEQKVQDYNAYVLTADQVAGIRGAENILKLTEAQRQFADAMQDYLSTVCAELNNEISRALYGVSIAKEKYYWPIRSSGVFSEMIRNQMQNPSNRQKNAGHMKATVRGANNAIELMGFMETWATHVNNTAMYNAFTLPMEDFMRVWNWKDTSGIGNRSMRQLILQKHGQAGVDYIDTFIKDLNKGVRGDPRESLLNSMLGKFKKGAVSASLSVAIQQPSAVGRALKYIDPKYFLGARVEGVDGINATWEVMQQYAPVVGIKDIGRFDMDMGRSTIDILSGKNETGVMATIDKLSGFLPEYMDKVTWVAMWEACKRQVKAQNPSLRGDALLTKAGELFTKTVTETQVYDSVFSRSGLMRSPSVAAKAVTAFMAEPTTTANMVYQAIQDFRHGDRTGAARSLASVGTAIVLNSLLASLVYASRDDDEEKTWLEKYLKSFTAELIDGVNPLGYIPVVKDIFSVFQGYDVIRSDMSQWADLAKTLQKFTKAWKSYGEADEDDREARKEALKNAGIASTNLLASILNLGGIPLRNLLREIQGGVNIVKDIQRGLPSDSRTKGYAIWEALNEYMPTIMRSDDGKSKQVYKAVTSGSAAWVNRLKSTYKDEDTFNRAVVTALVNNDSRIREAARAAVSGNSAERDRLEKEIVKEGHFTEEQVEAAVEKRIGQLPGASYDDMLDALRNGGDVKAAQANLAKYGYTQTQMENKVKSAAKEWYQGGVISAIDARKMLRDYGGMLTRDAQATVQKWTALLSTGTDFDEIQDEYLTGNLSRSRAVEMYVKFGGATQSDAEAAVKKWDCEKELGVKYDDLKDAYLGGDISADRVLSAMMKYGGVKEDSARATVEAYKWIRQHPKTELDVGQVKTYTKAIDTLGYSVEDAGISESVYLTFLEKASACTGEDRNGDGRTDSGSVQNQVVQVIDALPISGAQKDALYFAKGYAKQNLHKTPWH